MSLVSTYVESQSGTWYKNPTVSGDGWFICWDDDDPIELVIDATKNLKVDDILKDLASKGWRLTISSKAYVGAQRMFDGKFKPATAYFLRQVKLGPTDEMLGKSERVGARPTRDGVYYSNSTNGNGGKA